MSMSVPAQALLCSFPHNFIFIIGEETSLVFHQAKIESKSQ